MTLVLSSVRAFPNNPREHPEGQIARLTKSIRRVWTNPVDTATANFATDPIGYAASSTPATKPTAG
jgi:hypothetical protein